METYIATPPGSVQPQRDATSIALAGIVAWAWVLFGLAGLIYSLICTGRSGPFKMHVLGIVIAVFTGPLYWIFLVANRKSGYCT